MNALMSFISDNLITIGVLAFAWMLYHMASRNERQMLLVVAASLLGFHFSGQVEVAIAALVIGGGLMLLDHIRSRT